VVERQERAALEEAGQEQSTILLPEMDHLIQVEGAAGVVL
jgi:hypothetical protein